MEDISLERKKCVPCEGGTPPLSLYDVKRLMAEVKGWDVSADFKKIWKEYVFREFIDSIHFVNETARIAEEEGHHPDLHITYNKVLVELSTHAIGGLSLNDFILAAKIDNYAIA